MNLTPRFSKILADADLDVVEAHASWDGSASAWVSALGKTGHVNFSQPRLIGSTVAIKVWGRATGRDFDFGIFAHDADVDDEAGLGPPEDAPAREYVVSDRFASDKLRGFFYAKLKDLEDFGDELKSDLKESAPAWINPRYTKILSAAGLAVGSVENENELWVQDIGDDDDYVGVVKFCAYSNGGVVAYAARFGFSGAGQTNMRSVGETDKNIADELYSFFYGDLRALGDELKSELGESIAALVSP